MIRIFVKKITDCQFQLDVFVGDDEVISRTYITRDNLEIFERLETILKCNSECMADINTSE